MTVFRRERKKKITDMRDELKRFRTSLGKSATNDGTNSRSYRPIDRRPVIIEREREMGGREVCDSCRSNEMSRKSI